MITKVLKILRKISEENFTLLLFMISPFFFMAVPIGGFKFFVFFWVIVTLILYSKIGKLWLATFLVGIFTLQFLLPAKAYPVVAIENLISAGQYKGAYIKDFGISTSNILLFVTLLLSTRHIILNRKWRVLISRSRLSVVVGFLIFFCAGFISSYNLSPYFGASLVWLLQYSELFLIAILVNIAFLFNKTKYHLFKVTLLAMAVFQSVFGFMQFVKGATLGAIFEREQHVQFSVGDMDAVGSLYRVYGTFSHPNELALILLVLVCIMFGFLGVGKKIDKRYLYGIVISLITLILTQSRSVWLGLLIAVFVFGRLYFSDIKNFLIKNITRKLMWYLFLVFMLTSYVFIPRILLSINIFEEDGAVDLRLKMFKESVEALSQNSLVGYGVGTNESVLYSLFPNGVMSIFPASIHIGFVGLAMEVGLMGLLGFVLPFFYVFQNSAQVMGIAKLTREKKGLFYSYLTASVSVFIYFLFQPHWGQYDFAYLGLILGVGLNFLEIAYDKK